MANRHQSVYHITLNRQKTALKYLYLAFLVSLLGIPLMVKGLEGLFPWIADLVVVFMLFFLVAAGSVVYLHGTYFLKNINTSLWINPHKEVLTIRKGRHRHEYTFSQITGSVLVLPAYHRALKREPSFLKTPFAAYSYWHLRFHDGCEFVFTSLMVDYPVALGLTDTEVVVKFFPGLQGGKLLFQGEQGTQPALTWESPDECFSYYALKYRHYTYERLLEILADRHIDPEREQAIRDILAMRQV
jgi:hypothetical protein